MQSIITDKYISITQNYLYSGLNSLARSNTTLARLGSIPVCLVDGLLGVAKVPLKAIERVAFAAINFFGAAFNEKCNPKDGIKSAEGAVINILMCLPIVPSPVGPIPAALAVAPFKMCYQLFAGIVDPQNVKTFQYYNDIAEQRAIL